jgi:hypothetical protein
MMGSPGALTDGVCSPLEVLLVESPLVCGRLLMVAM